MHTIKVKKDELQRTLILNRDKHVHDFNQAMHGYHAERAEKLKELARKAADVQAAKCADERLFYTDAPPQSYEKEYAKSIRKLEMSVDDVIELDDNEFQQFVLDEWTWKQAFATSTAKYLGR